MVRQIKVRSAVAQHLGSLSDQANSKVAEKVAWGRGWVMGHIVLQVMLVDMGVITAWMVVSWLYNA